eukprot:TRINITY_DN150_c0_g5_i1.p1 TRINITY_DN150_c0_g5~~TRINITY_DN150_c0_g5_i1.p1  ORF type:complete len:528 (-),score=82.95 TRINITY_DN150_c0_g5_i1:78-1661(-)
MAPKSYTHLLSLLSFLSMLVPLRGAIVFDVYRMLQYEKVTTPFGSQRASVNQLAATLSSKPEALINSLVVSPLELMNETRFNELIHNKVDGFLFLFPPEGAPINRASLSSWKLLEQALLNQKFDFPVYFARSSSTQFLYQKLLAEDKIQASPMHDNYRLVVNAPEPKPIPNPTIANFQGWLAGTSATKADDGSLPTIAIVAHYDSFSIAPELAFGGDSNGSGVLALLELARLFSRLYAETRTHGSYNILFILTGGGKLNFVGTQSWLATTENRLLKSIDFTLCIDSIGKKNSEDGLFFHVSRPAKDDKTKRLYQAFSQTATSMKIPFEIVHKRINVSDPVAYWHHERFSRKRIISATVSHKNKPAPLFTESDLFDRQSTVDIKLLQRNIKFIAESLVKYMYNLSTHSNLTVFEGWLDLDTEFLSSWSKTLTKRSRMIPYFKTKDPILEGLERVLSEYASDVSNQTFKLESEYLFYDGMRSTMEVYKVKPILFDVILFVCIGVYLGALYFVLKWFGRDVRFDVNKKRS